MAYSPITTHVLDTSLGKPARNLPIKLFYMTKDSTWAVIKQGFVTVALSAIKMGYLTNKNY